jgi:hypothetical protein
MEFRFSLLLTAKSIPERFYLVSQLIKVQFYYIYHLGWNQVETIRHLVRKTGYRGSPDDLDMAVVRYMTRIETLGYSSYIELKEAKLKSDIQ